MINFCQIFLFELITLENFFRFIYSTEFQIISFRCLTSSILTILCLCDSKKKKVNWEVVYKSIFLIEKNEEKKLKGREKFKKRDSRISIHAFRHLFIYSYFVKTNDKWKSDFSLTNFTHISFLLCKKLISKGFGFIPASLPFNDKNLVHRESFVWKKVWYCCLMTTPMLIRLACLLAFRVDWEDLELSTDDDVSLLVLALAPVPVLQDTNQNHRRLLLPVRDEKIKIWLSGINQCTVCSERRLWIINTCAPLCFCF